MDKLKKQYIQHGIMWFYAGIVFATSGFCASSDWQPTWAKWLMCGMMLVVAILIPYALYSELRQHKDIKED